MFGVFYIAMITFRQNLGENQFGNQQNPPLAVSSWEISPPGRHL